MKKNVNKHILLIMIFVGIFILFQIINGGNEVNATITSGSKGNINWSYESDTKTLTISGSGENGVVIQSGHTDSLDNIIDNDDITHNLKIVDIKEGITEIEIARFSCFDSLTKLIIPDSVTNIEPGTYITNVKNLENIEVSEDNKTYSSLDGVLFDKKQQSLIKYPDRKTK